MALIGAGPASLACSAELRRRGIRAKLYDARPLPGGLNTYGVAEYKLPLVESLREIEMLSQLGVEFAFNTVVDAQALAELEQGHDAIFLGLGLGAIHRLGIPGEQLRGVTNALDLIAGYKSGELTTMPARSGRHRCGKHGHRCRHRGRPAGGERRTHRVPAGSEADVGIRL